MLLLRRDDSPAVLGSLVESAGSIGGFATLVTLALGLLVYAAGTLVEIFCESIMHRVVGNLAWAHYIYEYKLERSILFRVVAVPARAMFAPFRKSNFCWPIRDCDASSGIGEQLITGFPSSVLEGVRDPFGASSDIPWRFFAREEESDSVRDFTHKLEARNKDLLVIATSVFMTGALYYVAFRPEVIGWIFPTILGIVLLCLIVATLLWGIVGVSVGYFVLLRNSFLAIMKYRSAIDSSECALRDTVVPAKSEENAGACGGQR